ncbi:velvet factor-domain-containing protein [Trametes polyzona]|nr:velvet factor-domain-containing protein [Trametes polyzona]
MSAQANDWYPRPRAVDFQESQPANFGTGLLAGLTVRLDIDEIQKADRGRKYARKDKRPLDPPPVVLCSLMNIVKSGSSNVRETYVDAELAVVGSICHVDLFPVPSEEFGQYADPPSYSGTGHSASSPYFPHADRWSHQSDTPAGSVLVLPPPSSITGSSAWQAPRQTLPPITQLPSFAQQFPPAGPPYTTLSASSSAFGIVDTDQTPIASNHSAPHHGMESRLPGQLGAAEIGAAPSDPDIVAWLGSFPIRESSKCTPLLSGSTFTQAVVVEYGGKPVPMFIYSDLAVKGEGTFILRYRATNVASQDAGSSPYRVLAECYGGPFRVYSTKQFPGLSPSTALTKLLSMHGVHVNMRENERKRRKRWEIEADADVDVDVHGEENEDNHPGSAIHGETRASRPLAIDSTRMAREHGPASPVSDWAKHSPATSIATSSSFAYTSGSRYPDAQWPPGSGPAGASGSRYTWA